MIDSTFGKVNLRAAFRQTFENERVAYFLIKASASDEVIKARLAARVEDPQAFSDARLEDFSALSQAY